MCKPRVNNVQLSYSPYYCRYVVRAFQREAKDVLIQHRTHPLADLGIDEDQVIKGQDHLGRSATVATTSKAEPNFAISPEKTENNHYIFSKLHKPEQSQIHTCSEERCLLKIQSTK